MGWTFLRQGFCCLLGFLLVFASRDFVLWFPEELDVGTPGPAGVVHSLALLGKEGEHAQPAYLLSVQIQAVQLQASAHPVSGLIGATRCLSVFVSTCRYE